MALDDVPEINRITSAIIKAAIDVHRTLGPGLLESVYRTCLVFELRAAGVPVTTENSTVVIYKGMDLGCVFRLDAVVAGTVIVEVKAIERFAPIHDAQLMTYLRLTGLPAGLLINFNVPRLKDGLKRKLNTVPRSPCLY